jgi:hypothetical protein
MGGALSRLAPELVERPGQVLARSERANEREPPAVLAFARGDRIDDSDHGRPV